MANIIITGGCGFIGSHLVEFFINQGHFVHIIDDLSSGSMENINKIKHHQMLKISQADLCSWPGLIDAVKDADCIIHLAAVVGVYKVLANPAQVIRVNIDACQKLFDAVLASGKKPRVIIASSSMVYGQSKKNQQEENDTLVVRSTTEGHWIYAITKIIDESIALSFFKQYAIPATVIRIFNTIGLRQSGLYGMVVPRFIQQACEGKPITVYGDGTQTRSFCDVRDLVNAINLIWQNRSCIGEIINVGNDDECSINDLAKLIKSKAHSQSAIIHVPYNQAYHTNFSDIMNRRPNLTKLYRLTGHRNLWSLNKTISELISTKGISQWPVP